MLRNLTLPPYSRARIAALLFSTIDLRQTSLNDSPASLSALRIARVSSPSRQRNL